MKVGDILRLGPFKYSVIEVRNAFIKVSWVEQDTVVKERWIKFLKTAY